ncbi:MAG: aerotolerance regulator BatA [Cenarchaeum symbiont of Oopsacas minuta]|nr:aerotolerance regulator BatA [Cenarchaeum symbiont of Oopsacas minuta]
MMAGFDSIVFLLGLLILPVLYVIYYKVIKRKKKAAIKFSNLMFVKSAISNKKRSRRDLWLFIMSLAIIALMIIGFADPHIPLEQSKEGVNVVFVIDNSGSMLATDYTPNRLEAAKNSAAILLDSLYEKDHVGIIIFENGATTASYLSPFKERVRESLLTISPKQGKTALGDGLGLGIDMATSIPNKKKIVILLSDGVNNAGVISPNEAIEFAKVNSIQVYTIGMGSETPTIIGYDAFRNPQYAELDERTLQAIAEQTGGKYFKSIDKDTLDNIYQNISEEIEREKEQVYIKDWFFAIGFAMLFVQIYLRYGQSKIIQ